MLFKQYFYSVKKFLAIGFAFMYLLVSSGILLEIHHCMGRIADAGFTLVADSHSLDNTCSKCGMEKSNTRQHCCKDEYKLVKLTIDQKQSTSSFNLPAPEAIIPATNWYNFEQQVPVHMQELTYASHAPPFLNSPSQSLLCVFRI